MIQFKSLVAPFYLISTSPNFPPDSLNPNFHDFMLLYKKSCILFAIPNISKTAMRYFVIGSIHVIARLVCLLLQSLNTVLSVSSWSFVPWLPKWHPFRSDGSTFSLSWWLYLFLTNIPVISFHIKVRQDIGLYLSTALCFVRSFWHSTVFPKVIQSGQSLSPSRIRFSCTTICGCNDVRLFMQYPCLPSFPGAFQLGIFLHCIFTFSWPISTFLLKLFSTVFQPLSVLVMFFSYTPDITQKFDIRILNNSLQNSV